ncbi:unnamed protein product [marine sediment metagenome]|uniref:Uncharacterized protein n=1 Tax=marine sediment metagenome TaxID=412755 RepID=X0SZG1_9ZZZZ
MEQMFPIGTRVRMVGDVLSELKNKMCTVVPADDVKISHPNAYKSYPAICRMDELGGGHLYWAASEGTLKFVEGPERSIRCLINKRELTAHLRIIKQLVAAIKSEDYKDRDELIRCASAAADKIMEIVKKAPRGMTELEAEPEVGDE